MANPKFTCGKCGTTELEVYRDGYTLKFVPHKFYEEPMWFRCEGGDGAATANVASADSERLAEFERLTRPTPRPVSKTVVKGQDSAQNDAIQRRFERFHEQNPFVFKTLARISLQLKDEGRSRLSMSELFEKLRYEMRLNVASADAFKFSNDYRSRYARMLVKTFPELDGLFELRELRSVVGKEAHEV